MPVTPTSLSRLVPVRSWRTARGLAIIGWSLLACLCVVGVLVVLTLLVDLLNWRGRVPGVPPSEVAATLQIEWPAGSRRTDLGLGATAYRLRNVAAWSWLPAVCRSAPLLCQAHFAFAALVGTGLLLLLMLQHAQVRAAVNSSALAREAATRLRVSVHRQTLRLGPGDLSGQRFETALQIFAHEIERLRDALAQWRSRWARGVSMITILTLGILAIDWRLGIQCLVPAVACWWMHQHERHRGAAARQLGEAHAETEVRFLADALRKTRLVRGYLMEEFEQQLFQKHLDRLSDETRRGRRGERRALSTGRVLLTAGVALVILLIGMRILSVGQPLPVAFGVTLFAALVWVAFEAASLTRLSAVHSTIELCGDRLYRFLNEIPEVGQAVGAKFIEPVSQSIIFESVHYRTGKDEVLRGIDMRITAGTQVALTSLDALTPRVAAHMIPRFIEPHSGRVLFDSEDIAWGTLESIRAEAVYVGGDDPFLSGTVLENLTCGDSRFTLQHATEAAKLAHAHGFIARLPQGYETMLGLEGEKLSAGDAFRLGLARAALRNPAVIIIEEPSVTLDDDTKSLIDDAYQRLSEGRTIIYLPSRLSTVRRCDEVVFLHEGRVEACGPHSTLRKNSDLYRHWDYVMFNAYRRLKNDTSA